MSVYLFVCKLGLNIKSGVTVIVTKFCVKLGLYLVYTKYKPSSTLNLEDDWKLSLYSQLQKTIKVIHVFSLI